MKPLFDIGISTRLFITVIGSILIILLILTQSLLRNSEKFKKAKLYIESNKDVKERIGSVNGYGLFINSNEKSNFNSEMVFVVKGNRSDVKVRVYFKFDSINNWVVEKIRMQ